MRTLEQWHIVLPPIKIVAALRVVAFVVWEARIIDVPLKIGTVALFCLVLADLSRSAVRSKKGINDDTVEIKEYAFSVVAGHGVIVADWPKWRHLIQ